MYVAMATRRYGEGNVLLHTDRISGKHTGHGRNDPRFWRGVFEFCTSKEPHDTIRIGLVDNLGIDETLEAIDDVTGVTVKRVSYPYINLHGLGNFDCLYVSGLQSSLNSDTLSLITSFVDHGGGLIIESPNVAGNINLLNSIDITPVNSIQPPITTSGYWTIAGKSHYVFDKEANIIFMAELLETDFSSNWVVLITDIEVDDSTPDDYEDALVVFDANTSAEISVSFVIGMQKGIVQVTES